MNEQTKNGPLHQPQMTVKDGQVGKKQIEIKGTGVQRRQKRREQHGRERHRISAVLIR